jgi:hypothetical protein|tara:strand:+ start:6167 stop:6631 length:465 start_codon:yes stop_codon:yes gene_type:complete
MATETYTRKGLEISFDDGDFTSGTVSVLLDLDMRTGTPVDETGWLSGNAGGSYPGTLTGFTAQNTDGNAVGSMRMVTIQATLADAAEQTLTISAGASKIVAILGYSFNVTDKDLQLTFTNTGTAPATKTGGALPALVAHGEAAGQFTATVMLLN